MSSERDCHSGVLLTFNCAVTEIQSVSNRVNIGSWVSAVCRPMSLYTKVLFNVLDLLHWTYLRLSRTCWYSFQFHKCHFFVHTESRQTQFTLHPIRWERHWQWFSFPPLPSQRNSPECHHPPQCHLCHCQNRSASTDRPHPWEKDSALEHAVSQRQRPTWTEMEFLYHSHEIPQQTSSASLQGCNQCLSMRRSCRPGKSRSHLNWF